MGNDFPALDKVELDFTDWQLGAGDVIRVSERGFSSFALRALGFRRS